MTSITATESATLERAADAPMLAQVERWAAINSGTGNLAGLKTVAGQLADAFAALPGEVRLVAPDPVESVAPDGSIRTAQRGDHLHVRVRPDAPVQLLLTGHMDTVFAADHPFQTLRWLEAGVLNGPGTADMKAGIAVILAALGALEASPFAERVGYDVMINSDEETGSHASAALIAALARGKTAALTYEPALPDGTLAGARPGSGNFSVIVHGRSAHAGRNPDDGRNALIAAADLALRLNALKSPELKVNPAKIDGGGPNNVVPDSAILRVNLRPSTPGAMVEAEAALRAAVDAVSRDHDVHCHIHGNFNRPPKPLDPAATRLFELVQGCGAALGLPPIRWNATGGVCDGNNIAACGIPVVDTMGPRGGAIHSADEFLIVDSLAERAQLSALTMMKIAERGDCVNYVIRAAKPGDLQSIYEMAKLTGGGFTNLPPDKKALRTKLERAEASFASDKEYPSDELYLLVLEDLDSGEVRGTCQIFGQVGQRWPFYSYRIGTDSKHSEQLDRTFHAQVLMLSNDLNGASEVGGLFLHPAARAGGLGLLLARSRYLFIARHRARFGDRILAELRGVIDEAGGSPFWDGVAGKFFGMSFQEADQFNAVHGNQFIADLMPKHPVYIAMLSDHARSVIGVPHPSGRAAMRMLENENFAFENYVDIFDGGPTMTARTDQVASISGAKHADISALVETGGDALVATGRLADFRCCFGKVGDGATLDAAAAKLLGVDVGSDISWIGR